MRTFISRRTGEEFSSSTVWDVLESGVMFLHPDDTEFFSQEERTNRRQRVEQFLDELGLDTFSSLNQAEFYRAVVEFQATLGV
jgi:hypothetical protein